MLACGDEMGNRNEIGPAGGRSRKGNSYPTKYYNWDFLLAPTKSRALVSGDYFYAIETDADEENFWVKRYKIVWE
jgi:hypothetical protein